MKFLGLATATTIIVEGSSCFFSLKVADLVMSPKGLTVFRKIVFGIL